jgi:hypothetical protein
MEETVVCHLPGRKPASVFLTDIYERDPGSTAGVRFPAGARDFSLLHSVQNGSGAHPASYPVVPEALSRGGKAAGA